MATPTCRAADNKREEFRRYLERNGVMESITRALVALYEESEKPEDPLRYICHRLHYRFKEQPTVDALKSELGETTFELRRLREQMSKLTVSDAATNTNTDCGRVPTTTSIGTGSASSSISTSPIGVFSRRTHDDELESNCEF